MLKSAPLNLWFEPLKHAATNYDRIVLPSNIYTLNLFH